MIGFGKVLDRMITEEGVCVGELQILWVHS